MVYIFESLIIEQEGDDRENIEMYINDKDEIFVTEVNGNSDWFFTFSKSDWEIMKDFVNRHFEE